MKCLLIMNIIICGLFINEVRGLKCYTCDNCLKEAGSKTDCGSIGDTCLKLDMGDTVMKSCIRHELCNVQGVEGKLKSLWATLTNQKPKPQKSNINCCNSELCNSGVLLSKNFGLLAFGIMIAFFYAC